MTKRDVPPDLRATLKILDEAQLDRIEAMSPEELDEAMRAQGLDPNAPFGIEEMLAKLPPEEDGAAASQARGSPAGASPAGASPAGASPAGASPAGASPAPSSPLAPVVAPVPKRRRSRAIRFAWLVLPAAAAVVAAFELPNRVTPDPLAGELRDEAANDCAQQRWEPCRRSLDEARKLDPAGESEERVVKLREAIARSEEAPEPKPIAPETPPREFPPFEAKPPMPREKHR